MASRDYLKHIVSDTFIINATIGDELFRPTDDKFYKRLAVAGTDVQWAEIPHIAEDGDLDLGAQIVIDTLTGTLSVYYSGTQSVAAQITGTGDITVNGNANLGNLSINGIIDSGVSGGIGVKHYYEGTSLAGYNKGVGVESDALTFWYDDNIRWRFGSDGLISGTQRMLLSSTGLTVNGSISDSAGDVRNIVNNAQTGAYILAATDNGELINITTGGVTVNSGIFSAGNNITIYNNSASSQTITQGAGVTLRLAGTATTGNRTLSQRGIATIVCVAANEFVISGSGLS